MPTPNYDTSKPVLVTGATGFLAGWIVKDLLERGFTVHATVRDPENEKKIAHLKALGETASGQIRFFAANLLDEGAFDEAMKGCGTVFHTASPFTYDITDPQLDLVDPAVNGTKNVLNAVNRTESVKRVVLTSSCAAIYGDSADTTEAPGGKITEEVWNETSTLDHVPYSFSKTLAEKAAWEIAGAQDRWKLVAINPALITGPALNAMPTSEVFSIFKQFTDGTMKSGAPFVEVGVVDVRDVSQAHLNAAFIEDANGRNIIFNRHMSFHDMGQAISEKWPNMPVPKRVMPKWLIWLIGPMVNKAFARKWVSRNVGHNWRGDNSKGIRELGMSYMPVETSIQDMVQNMIDQGLIKAP